MYTGVSVCCCPGAGTGICLQDESLSLSLCSHRRPVVGTDDKLVLIAITQWVVIAFYSELMATINADYKTLGAFLSHSPDIVRPVGRSGSRYRTAVLRHTMTVRLIQCRFPSSPPYRVR